MIAILAGWDHKETEQFSHRIFHSSTPANQIIDSGRSIGKMSHVTINRALRGEPDRYVCNFPRACEARIRDRSRPLSRSNPRDAWAANNNNNNVWVGKGGGNDNNRWLHATLRSGIPKASLPSRLGSLRVAPVVVAAVVRETMAWFAAIIEFNDDKG